MAFQKTAEKITTIRIELDDNEQILSAIAEVHAELTNDADNLDVINHVQYIDLWLGLTDQWRTAITGAFTSALSVAAQTTKLQQQQEEKDGAQAVNNPRII